MNKKYDKKDLKWSGTKFQITKSALQEDDNIYSFDGLISTVDLDRGNDVIRSVAYDRTLRMFREEGHKISVLWQHKNNEPLGTAITLNKTDNGLLSNFILPKNDKFVTERVMPQIDIGSIQGISIGFNLLDYDYDETSGITYINDMIIWEFSLVTIPMNANARIIGYKSLDQVQTELNDLEKALQLGTPISKELSSEIIEAVKAYQQNKIDSKKQDELKLLRKFEMLEKLNKINSIM